MSDSIEFTDRYQALGMDYPNPDTVCKGFCEGTGFVPVRAGDSDPDLARLWDEAEKTLHAEDGVHLVKCPTCEGTGRRKDI